MPLFSDTLEFVKTVSVIKCRKGCVDGEYKPVVSFKFMVNTEILLTKISPLSLLSLPPPIFGKVKRVKSAYEPSGPSGQRLTPVSVA